MKMIREGEITHIADGIVRVEGAGHGGYRLSAERDQAVTWYEQNCDWALVYLSFQAWHSRTQGVVGRDRRMYHDVTANEGEHHET